MHCNARESRRLVSPPRQLRMNADSYGTFNAPACRGPPALPRVKSFWRNVILIALAHIALVAGLIRWSVAAKTPSNPESIVWLGGMGDLSAGEEEEKEEASSSNQPATEAESTN